MNRIVSGIQPTGSLHLGNYLGAMRNWVNLQEMYDDALFCIVDLHAFTTLPQAQDLRTWIRETAAAYIAAGIDPTKSSIFVQSTVPEHTELAWIFNCLTSLGWLNRMTQFKEKAGKHREQANLGLYAYPVLQAADILLYKATYVPIGEDQKQHLELTRDIAGTFNRVFKVDYFLLPEPLIVKESARIMSLRDGTSKMSKSDESPYSRIQFTDMPDTIALKIRKAKTDPHPLAATPEAMETRPEALNLLKIYAALSEISLEQACQQFADDSFTTLKTALTERLIDTLTPIQQEMQRLLKDPTFLDTILKEGTEKARALAQQTNTEVREIVGFPRV